MIFDGSLVAVARHVRDINFDFVQIRRLLYFPDLQNDLVKVLSLGIHTVVYRLINYYTPKVIDFQICLVSCVKKRS